MTKEEEIELAWRLHQGRQFIISQRRGSLRPMIRDQLAGAQNWRCCYCGVGMHGGHNAKDSPTFEHVVPLAFGGTNDLENVVIACKDCNERHGIAAGTVERMFCATYYQLINAACAPCEIVGIVLLTPHWLRNMQQELVDEKNSLIESQYREVRDDCAGTVIKLYHVDGV